MLDYDVPLHEAIKEGMSFRCKEREQQRRKREGKELVITVVDYGSLFPFLAVTYQ